MKTSIMLNSRDGRHFYKEKTANVYKYISDNKFYHDFMMEHYADLINRRL